ncbi:MAG: hypothetical protein K9G59_10410 [Caulobacter sp.]|nr:hypothetical protein [Caulobacter sp.]
MRTAFIVAVAGAAALLGAFQAQAFGTIRTLGQNAEHERITRQGLAAQGFGPLTLDELAGKRGTFGGVGAPDRPNRGLMSSSEAHCDNGDWLDVPDYSRPREVAQTALEQCRAYIFARMNEAVADAGKLVEPGDFAINLAEASIAKGCRFNGRKAAAKCNVLEQLGMAFHASQDFYSHTNWVDPVRRAGSRLDDPPGMGQAAPTYWLDQALADHRFPDGLISGCYEGFPESRHCEGRVKHAILSKDTERSPRGAGGVYRLAMDVAAEDTNVRWIWFETRLIQVYGVARGSRIACVVRRDDPLRCKP